MVLLQQLSQKELKLISLSWKHESLTDENANIDNLADENGSEGLPSDETSEVAVFRGTGGFPSNLLSV